MNKRERIGSLNEIIAFQTYLEGRGKFGQVNKTWLTSNDVWAKVVFDDSKEAEESLIGDRLTTEFIVVFTIRRVEGLAPYMRIIYQKREYNILLVAPIDRSYMTIRARSTEPDQVEKTWIDPQGQNWIDPQGNSWVWLGDGVDQAEKLPYSSPGGFTWKDSQGNTFYQQ